MVKLVHQFLEVVELLEEEVREKSEGWAIKVVVARSLDQRISMEEVAHEFRQ